MELSWAPRFVYDCGRIYRLILRLMLFKFSLIGPSRYTSKQQLHDILTAQVGHLIAIREDLSKDQKCTHRGLREHNTGPETSYYARAILWEICHRTSGSPIAIPYCL